MLPTRRAAASILALILASHLLGCGGNITLALLSDTEAVPATFATAACFIADDVPPSVSSTVISKTVPYLPGFVRQGGTYYVYADVTDGGCAPSGIETVTANVSTVTTGATAIALAPGAFTIGGTAYNHRSASITANGTLTPVPRPTRSRRPTTRRTVRPRPATA